MTEQGSPRARRVTKRGGEPTAANSTMHGERHAHAASWPACALAQLCSGPAPAGCDPAVCVLDKRIDVVASTEQHHAILFPKHNVYHVCFVAHNTNMCASWSALCIMECIPQFPHEDFEDVPQTIVSHCTHCPNQYQPHTMPSCLPQTIVSHVCFLFLDVI